MSLVETSYHKKYRDEPNGFFTTITWLDDSEFGKLYLPLNTMKEIVTAQLLLDEWSVAKSELRHSHGVATNGRCVYRHHKKDKVCYEEARKICMHNKIDAAIADVRSTIETAMDELNDELYGI